MSSFAGYCSWCSKPVMHKTLFGTLHLCLTEEERRVIALQSQQRQQQQLVSPNTISLLKQLNATTPAEKEKR